MPSRQTLKRVMVKAVQIRTDDPKKVYRLRKKLGEGAGGEVKSGCPGLAGRTAVPQRPAL